MNTKFEIVVRILGQWCVIRHAGWYGDKTPAIKITTIQTDEPMATLTVCQPGTKLAEDELLVKGWIENEPVIEACRKLNEFVDTGRRVSVGYCLAEVWKLVLPELTQPCLDFHQEFNILSLMHEQARAEEETIESSSEDEFIGGFGLSEDDKAWAKRNSLPDNFDPFDMD